MRDGTLCAIGRGPNCGTEHAALFWAYCFVDFHCYFFGLYVIQKGGATLMVLTTAIALPLQQLVLCLKPLLGKWSERFFWGDALSLVLVLLGFAAYQLYSPEAKAARAAQRAAITATNEEWPTVGCSPDTDGSWPPSDDDSLSRPLHARGVRS